MNALREAAEMLIDERVGIVRWIAEIPRQPGSPDYFHYAAQAADTSAFSKQWNFAVSGGASNSRATAVSKALGEAVERYCAAIYDKDEFALCSQRDADFPAVCPRDFALFSDDQLQSEKWPYAKFDEQSCVRWTAAMSLVDSREVFVPAAMVYVPYMYDADEAAITQPISTGLACGSSFESAVCGSICEVVERDAFTLMWHGQISPPQILVETLSDANYDLVSRFDNAGGKVFLFDVTTDLRIPAVVAVLRDVRRSSPALVFAAAAALDPEQAICKSLEELAHTHRYMQELKEMMDPIILLSDYTNVVDQRTHLRFWCEHENAALADFLFSSSSRREFLELPSCRTSDGSVSELINRISATGLKTYVADITTSDVRGLGLTVTRAIIPGANPLFMGHRYRARGGSRLGKLIAGRSDNLAPHPFP